MHHNWRGKHSCLHKGKFTFRIDLCSNKAATGWDQRAQSQPPSIPARFGRTNDSPALKARCNLVVQGKNPSCENIWQLLLSRGEEETKLAGILVYNYSQRNLQIFKYRGRFQQTFLMAWSSGSKYCFESQWNFRMNKYFFFLLLNLVLIFKSMNCLQFMNKMFQVLYPC